jgi:hypothetical protein
MNHRLTSVEPRPTTTVLLSTLRQRVAFRFRCELMTTYLVHELLKPENQPEHWLKIELKLTDAPGGQRHNDIQIKAFVANEIVKLLEIFATGKQLGNEFMSEAARTTARVLAWLYTLPGQELNPRLDSAAAYAIIGRKLQKCDCTTTQTPTTAQGHAAYQITVL